MTPAPASSLRSMSAVFLSMSRMLQRGFTSEQLCIDYELDKDVTNLILLNLVANGDMLTRGRQKYGDPVVYHLTDERHAMAVAKHVISADANNKLLRTL